MLIKIDKMQIGEKLPVYFSKSLPPIKGYGILEKEHLVTVDGIIKRYEDYYSFVAQIHTQFTVECALCLKQVKQTMDFATHYKFSSVLETLGDEEVLPCTSKQINLEDAIISDISINMPIKIKCLEDCKGLCPMCGKNLNVSQCNCSSNEIDERFSILNNIFD